MEAGDEGMLCREYLEESVEGIGNKKHGKVGLCTADEKHTEGLEGSGRRTGIK